MSSQEDEKKDSSDEEQQDVLLQCADLRYKLSLNKKDEATKAELFKILKENRMVSFYTKVWTENEWGTDSSELEAWEAGNKKQLDEIEAERKNAEENLGDTEIRDAEVKKAKVITLSGDKDAAVKEWVSIEGLTKGKKIDAYLQILRILLAYDDDQQFKTYCGKTEELVEKGGDWDRRNRLSIYKAMHAIRIRNFKTAAEALLKAIQTFTAYEICDYESFIFYTVCAAVPTLERKVLKKDVIDSPEVLQVLDKIPFLRDFLNCLYQCNYSGWFKSIVGLMPQVRSDRYMTVHANFFLRELRFTAYNQFLRSYRTVTLVSMAKAFGVTPAFLDSELSDFISAGRLSAKIDAVNGVIETSRPDRKNADYQMILRRGDNLLNRLQKLSKVITL